MLSSKVLRTVERHRMVQAGDRVVIGVSGGADSVALTEVLVELAEHLEIRLVLAHLNHALRAESGEDEAFCRSLAERLSLPFASSRVDVAEKAQMHRRSIEDEGRVARYEFLEGVAYQFGARRIAVGHTLDDQAETVLLRLLRGSGGRGLGSIYPIKGSIVRPLLDARRAEIERYLQERGAAFREDSSNADPRFTRNRIRHEDLPRLSAAYNPRLVETLARCASVLRDEEEWMEATTREAFDTLATASGDEVRLDGKALSRQPLALRRRLVRAAIERLRGLENVSHRHIEDVLVLAEERQSGRELHLPGLVVELSFDQVRFKARAGGPGARARNPPERGYNGFEYRLPIPARVRIRECFGTLWTRIAEANRTPRGAELEYSAVGNAVVVGFEGEVPELRVRSPRPGDRFHPLGAPGSKPISRYLMDRKISRDARSRVPLVVRGDAFEAGKEYRGNSREEILWVVGHGVSETSRVSPVSSRLSMRWVAS